MHSFIVVVIVAHFSHLVTIFCPSVAESPSFSSFGSASASFMRPVECQDVALTQDGRRLLLAARQHGLIELLSASGHERSSWLPPKHSSRRGCSTDDQVLAVAALSDRRAAVSLFHAEVVVLLRRNKRSNRSNNTGRDAAISSAITGVDEAWTEYRRFDLQLQYSWWKCLTAHGDVLAACDHQEMQLLSLSGQRLSNAVLQREYVIGSLAVAARAVVTGSYYKVELGSGRRAAHVLDAHILDADDKRLWRYVLNDDGEQMEEYEELWGVCADPSGSCLYASVCMSDSSSGRVSVLSMADGRELRRVALSFSSAAAAAHQPLLLPRRLSLCDDKAAAKQQQSNSSSSRSSCRGLLLAALCLDSATNQWKTVTLHRSISRPVVGETN